MAISDLISVPGLDLSNGTLTAPLWVPAAAAGLIVLLLILAIFRAGWVAVFWSVVRIGLVVIVVIGGWALLQRWADRDRAEERRVLDNRLAELASRETAPGSVLGCLETGIGDTVGGACEKAVFASPESIGSASAHTAARLALLADGLEFAGRADPTYERVLIGLRRSIEADRFGFVAQLLATRDGCSATKCAAFALLTDSKRVAANIGDHTFDGLVARNATAWAQRSGPGTPLAAVPVPAPGPAPTPVTGITYPSSASIPPVSIMTGEPAAPPSPAPAAPTAPATTTHPAAAGAPRQPKPQHPPKPPQQANPQAPVPLGPPAAASASGQPHTQ